jgi:hypothetical protein
MRLTALLFDPHRRAPHLADHASGKIFNFPQYSNTALETIKSSLQMEAMAREEGFCIKAYHSDNGIFTSPEFKNHCAQYNQKYSFGGVGAKHQNGVAERNIKTVAQWARANMLHLATHWPQHANSTYWPQAINYAVWVFNRLPNMEFGIAPNKNLVRCLLSTHQAILFTCLWVPSLCTQRITSRWKENTKMESLHTSWSIPGFLRSAFLSGSFSPQATGHISPQFHIIFDDKFETIKSLPLDQHLN